MCVLCSSNSIMFCCGREIFHIIFFLIEKHTDLLQIFPCELVLSSAAVTFMRLEKKHGHHVFPAVPTASPPIGTLLPDADN